MVERCVACGVGALLAQLAYATCVAWSGRVVEANGQTIEVGRAAVFGG